MKNLLFGLVVIAVVSMAHCADKSSLSKSVAEKGFEVAKASYLMCIRHGTGFLHCLDAVISMLDPDEKAEKVVSAADDVEHEVDKLCGEEKGCKEKELGKLKTILVDVLVWSYHVCHGQDKANCFFEVFKYYLREKGHKNILEALDKYASSKGDSNEASEGDSGKASEGDSGKASEEARSLRQLLRDYIERESK